MVSLFQRVAEVTDSWWHSMLILPPLFKDSPASPFLSAYYPDCVGMSPSGSPSNTSQSELRVDLCRTTQPQSRTFISSDLRLIQIKLCVLSQRGRSHISSQDGLVSYGGFHISSISSRLVSVLPAFLPAQRVWKSSVRAPRYDGVGWTLWVSWIFPRSHHVLGFA